MALSTLEEEKSWTLWLARTVLKGQLLLYSAEQTAIVVESIQAENVLEVARREGDPQK